MDLEKTVATIRYKAAGGAYIQLFNACNGKLIFENETETKTETEKCLKIISQELGQGNNPITLSLPCEHSIRKRYDLSDWKEFLYLGTIYSTLCRFPAILNEKGITAPPAIILLGTLLSGYTSEFFHKQIQNSELPIRALVLDVPWEGGITQLLQKAIAYLAPNLYPYAKKASSEYIHYNMPQDFAPESESESPEDMASFSPQWPFPHENNLAPPLFSQEPIVGDSEYCLTYQNIGVLIQAAYGFKLPKVEAFLMDNPFCAAIVIRRPRQRLCMECTLVASALDYAYFNLSNLVWSSMESLVKYFLSQIFSSKSKSFPWKGIWRRAQKYVNRYRILNRKFTTAQAHTYCILCASLLAFLECLQRSGFLTKEEHAEASAAWMNTLMPGSVHEDADASTRGYKSKLQYTSHTRQTQMLDYVQIFKDILQKVCLADSGIHILDMTRANSQKQWYITETSIGAHEIYGYKTMIHAAGVDSPSSCLLFRKKTLINLIQSSIEDEGYTIKNPNRLLREVKLSEWGHRNILSQRNGIYKKRMPVDDLDNSVVDAVAVKCTGLPFMQQTQINDECWATPEICFACDLNGDMDGFNDL